MWLPSFTPFSSLISPFPSRPTFCSSLDPSLTSFATFLSFAFYTTLTSFTYFTSIILFTSGIYFISYTSITYTQHILHFSHIYPLLHLLHHLHLHQLHHELHIIHVLYNPVTPSLPTCPTLSSTFILVCLSLRPSFQPSFVPNFTSFIHYPFHSVTCLSYLFPHVLCILVSHFLYILPSLLLSLTLIFARTPFPHLHPSFPYLPSLLSFTFSSTSFLHFLPSTPSITIRPHILLVSYHKYPFEPVTLLCPVGFRWSTHRDASLPVEPAHENWGGDSLAPLIVVYSVPCASTVIAQCNLRGSYVLRGRAHVRLVS